MEKSVMEKCAEEKGAASNYPLIYADDHFTIEQSQECPLLGYLIVRVKPHCTALTDLDPALSSALFLLIKRAQELVTELIAPEKIYLCSFGEIQPQLHYHLFPRTQALTEQYWMAHPEKVGKPIDGLHLMGWTKESYEAMLSVEAINGLRDCFSGHHRS